MATRNDEPFPDLTAPAGPHSLAVYSNMVQFLKGKAQEFLNNLGRGVRPIDAAQPVAQHIARVLLGKDPEWDVIPGWHTPGAIDLAVYRAMELNDNDPDEVMEHWGVAFLTDVYKIMEYASEPGVTDEQWQWQLEDIYERYARMALGMSEPEDEEE